MYEHRTQPLMSRERFTWRMLRHALVAFGVIGVGLGVGVLGYHWLEDMGWIDSLLNASMIFSGEGPIAPPKTDAGKIFASFYGLISVIVFLSSIGVLLAPAIHRGLHKFHLEAANHPPQKPL